MRAVKLCSNKTRIVLHNGRKTVVAAAAAAAVAAAVVVVVVVVVVITVSATKFVLAAVVDMKVVTFN